VSGSVSEAAASTVTVPVGALELAVLAACPAGAEHPLAPTATANNTAAVTVADFTPADFAAADFPRADFLRADFPADDSPRAAVSLATLRGTRHTSLTWGSPS
jgi:uncharacterized protein YjbI with pentapeptide repeats